MSKLKERLIRKLKRYIPTHNGNLLDWDAADFCIAEGYWRSSPYVDVYRWEVSVPIINTNIRVRFGCWYSMTECVRKEYELASSSFRGVPSSSFSVHEISIEGKAND